MTNRRAAIWDAINRVVAASGGDPSNTSTARQLAVVEVEKILEQFELKPNLQLDPIHDYDTKLLTRAEFAEALKTSVNEYEKCFRNSNEWQDGSHTYLEWMKSFTGWESW